MGSRETRTAPPVCAQWRGVIALATAAAFILPLFTVAPADGKRLKRPSPPTTTAPTTTTTTTAPTTTTTTAPTTTTTTVPTRPAGSFPTVPPAQVCDNTEVLSGPAIPPVGSVRVDPGQDLNAITQSHPSGTTFWLSPGTHTLGSSEYGQVVPKNNNVYTGAPGATLDGRNLNRYAFTAHATGVTITHLTIQNFGAIGGNNNEGVVNHDGGSGWTISYNTIQGNAGAGLFIGPKNFVSSNCLRNNGQYGFSMYKPEAGALNSITIDRNEIMGNNTYDWEAKIAGCGCSGGGKFWDARNVAVTNNWVHHNRSVGLWADTNNIGFVFDGNFINDNDSAGIFYEISYNAKITNNTLKRNALVTGKEFAARGDNFPVAAIYLSESGGDSRLNGGVYDTLEISGNSLVDNWGGVALWENADRFCGSAANTSGGYCTAVNPSTTNLTACVADTIKNEPHYSDCRWKTKNVLVTNNEFNFSRSNVGCVTTGCGQQGIISNWGTYPSWSPYTGRTIQDAITFNQNNRFTNNTYVGDWKFVPYETSNFKAFSSWQAAPYGQDAGSTFVPDSEQTTTGPSEGLPSPSDTTLPGNHLDADTASLDASVGSWSPWFSAAPSRSTLQAQSGSASLKVDISTPYGWGVQLSKWPGFAATAGEKTIRFWGLNGAGIHDATMTVKWKDGAGADLQVDSVSIPVLGASWQKAEAKLVAPVGTASVWVELSGSSGLSGDHLYIDELYVGSQQV